MVFSFVTSYSTYIRVKRYELLGNQKFSSRFTLLSGRPHDSVAIFSPFSFFALSSPLVFFFCWSFRVWRGRLHRRRRANKGESVVIVVWSTGKRLTNSIRAQSITISILSYHHYRMKTTSRNRHGYQWLIQQRRALKITDQWNSR